MTKVVFPGSFDPIHLGHVDIARRAAEIFDEVVVAVYDRPSKNMLFSPLERIRMARECLKPYENIEVVSYSGLTINFAKEIKAKAIVRGLRVFSDYEYEFRMALANHRLNDAIDTIALITAEENMFISSSTVKEIATFGGDVSSMVPPLVEKALKIKYKIKESDPI
jgi:pantetheine-phosphate adenylyltransferase